MDLLLEAAADADGGDALDRLEVLLDLQLGEAAQPAQPGLALEPPPLPDRLSSITGSSDGS